MIEIFGKMIDYHPGKVSKIQMEILFLTLVTSTVALHVHGMKPDQSMEGLMSKVEAGTPGVKQWGCNAVCWGS